MFCCTVNEQIELRLIERRQGGELFKLFDSNREHWARWHPWMGMIQSVNEVEKIIAVWQQLHATNRGFFTGIWFREELCGMINHQNVDWPNRWSVLSYWLDSAHQGRGIMTASCRALISHGFNTWKLNRITIECATQNARSRAIPERLGFKLEGILRGVEWLQDGYVDHALYGLLRSEYTNDHHAGDESRLPSSRMRVHGHELSSVAVRVKTSAMKAGRYPSAHDQNFASCEAG